MIDLYELKEISKQKFDEYVAAESCGAFLQTSSWGIVKKENWVHFFVGLSDKKTGELAGAALVLVCENFRGFKAGYIPRGPVLREWNEESVAAFSYGMKSIMESHGCAFYRIDPMLVYHSRCVGNHSEEILNPWKKPETEFERIAALLEKYGLQHMGFEKKLSSYIQPRINVLVPLAKEDGSFFDLPGLRRTFSKRTKEYLGSFHANRGLTFERAEPTEENIHIVSTLIRMTADRKGIALRDEAYFRNMCHAMGDKVSLYIARCHLPAYLNFLLDKKRKSKEDAERLDARIAEALAVQRERGNDLVLSAMLHGFPPNKNGLRIAEYLYSGTDVSVFSHFHVAAGLMYYTMGDCIARNCQFINLGGIEDEETDPLYQFKACFNSIVLEYGGEWHGVVADSHKRMPL